MTPSSGSFLTILLAAALTLAGCGREADDSAGSPSDKTSADDTSAAARAGEGTSDDGAGTIDTSGLTVPGGDTIPPKAPGADSLVELAGSAPSRGRPDAAVVIVEFSDFECPFCSKARETIDRLMRDRPDARLVYMQFPILSLHPGAMLPAEASLEAHRQGRFWEYHDALFAHERPLDRAVCLGIAEDLGLDVAAMTRALDERTHRARVEREMRIGQDLGITGTPTFYFNGYKLTGALPYETFVTVYNLLLRASRRPALAEAAPAG